jgi:hypothetical protein
MTTDELKQYYADLLILQYRGKPRARATIEAFVDLAIMDQLPLIVASAFALGAAVGVQLDILGKYVGVTRQGYLLNGSAVTLSDDDFTNLLKLAIIQNASGSSLSEIQALLQQFFPGILQVFDFQGMRMGYFLDKTSVPSENLAEVFVKSGSLPKPMAVELGSLIYAETIDNIFGWGSYDEAYPFNTHGFNTYDQYDTDCHWLQSSDFIGA